MSDFYHFVARSNRSKLILGRNYEIQHRIANFLTDFQHEAINFLYEHFEKHTSCILNLESGLGKTALVCAFLNAVLPHDSSRKCLIIVKNDEHIINWQFHLDVLTNLSSKVVLEENEIGKESVYIIKCDSLRSSASLLNINFDCIIVDNRGDLLANIICLAYLLRNYENKISLIISSNDVSIDLKQFHAILRLCGRLESPYLSFKSFEDNFSLPRITGMQDDRNELESYFLRREKILNFCRNFCLRRYRHQFKDQLPLCKSDVYKQSIKRWQEKSKQFNFLRKPIPNLSRNSFRSCQILSSSSDRDTEELFRSFFSKHEEEQLNEEVTRITTIASENNSNENSQLDNALMSPLLFIPDTDDEKLEQTVSSTTKDIDNRNIIQPTPIKKNNNSPVKRRTKRIIQLGNNEITPRITRGMERLTRSKTQKSKYLLLDIESTMKRDSNIKALKRRIKNNQIAKNKGTAENIDIISSTILTPNLNTKKNKGKQNQTSNIVDIHDEFLFNGQQFGDYINEVEFVENNNNHNVNNYSNSIYETHCDFSVDSSPILPDTSEINIMSQSEPVVIILSSSSDSSVNLTTNNNNLRKKSPSPDLFSTYDEFNITCSQKNQSNQNKHLIPFLKNSKEVSNKRSLEVEKNNKKETSCLNILETQQKPSTSSVNNCSSKSTELQNNNTIICIDLDKEKTPVIDKSIMGRNLLVRQRSNSNFLQQNNKITNYLCNEQNPSTSINDTSQTSSILPVPVESPKTPKRKISERSLKINSVSKKSPHTKSTPTTPSSLRSWLISSSGTSTEVIVTQNAAVNKKTTKRRRLDTLF